MSNLAKFRPILFYVFPSAFSGLPINLPILLNLLGPQYLKSKTDNLTQIRTVYNSSIVNSMSLLQAFTIKGFLLKLNRPPLQHFIFSSGESNLITICHFLALSLNISIQHREGGISSQHITHNNISPIRNLRRYIL